MKAYCTLLICMLCLYLTKANAQLQTENIVIFTLDGMRWQEVFGGADSILLSKGQYTKDPEGTKAAFWAKNADERRKKLFPFLWSVVAKQGQLYGNRNLENKVNNANPYQFSYPGYNEIFTGYPDSLANSNDKIWNKNENVLEFINKQKKYQGKIAAFSSWDVFPYILNNKRSGLYVNSDVDSLKFTQPSLQIINDMQFIAPRPIGVRPDVITYFAAREYWKAYQPKILYIAFDETDDFAHAGEYDQYLKSAHAEDKMIENMWNLIQSNPKYKNKTTLIITCDHGRGDKNKDDWRDHGQNIVESGEIWIAALGPDTKPLGEMKKGTQLYQKQLASTLAALLGLQFTANHPVAEPITSIYTK
jgi:hypothetical protein